MNTPIGKQIASAFVKAQKAFGPALKTSTNPHFRSQYADLSNCVEAVIDALNDNGIALLQRTYESPNGVTVETVFIHESGEVIEGGLFSLPASKQDAMGYGSALTYARRYSLLAATGLAPEKAIDDDGVMASRKPEKPTVLIAPLIASIDAATTEDELKVAYFEAIKVAGHDAAAKNAIIVAKDLKKASL